MMSQAEFESFQDNLLDILRLKTEEWRGRNSRLSLFLYIMRILKNGEKSSQSLRMEWRPDLLEESKSDG